MTPPRTPTGEHIRVVDEPRDSYKAITADEVTDPALLPRHVRMIGNEVRDLVEVLRGQVVPALRRIEEQQHEQGRYAVTEIANLHARLDEIALALGQVRR